MVNPIRGRRILIVEDDQDTAELLGDTLRQFGHEALIALDGPAALRICQAYRPEVALVDLGLPGMDGFEVASCLRALPRPGSLCIVAVTSRSTLADQERTRRAGFDAHVSKPVDVARLTRLLHDDLPVRR